MSISIGPLFYGRPVPLGILALVFGYIGLPRERIQWRPLIHADLAGLIALSAALGLFACAVSQGDRMRWFQTPTIPILFAASALCLAIFVLRDWSELRHPIVWVKLYKRWNVTLAAIGLLPLGLAIGMSGVIVPAALAQVQHFRPEQVAPALWAAFWPQAFSYAACVIILTRKIFEVRAMIIAGLAVVAIGAFFNLQITSEWQVGELYVGQLIQGVGLPMIAVPLIDIFVASLRPPAESLPAASVLNLSRVLSGTIATAWATTSLRLNSQGKFGELLINTGFYHGRPRHFARQPRGAHGAYHLRSYVCSSASLADHRGRGSSTGRRSRDLRHIVRSGLAALRQLPAGRADGRIRLGQGRFDRRRYAHDQIRSR